MIQTLQFTQRTISTRLARQLACASAKPLQRTLFTPGAATKPKSLLMRRSDAKQPNHQQAHDILKSIEEKQALDKKKAADTLEKSQQKKTMWQKVKAEAVHYWHGTKLLGLEVRISSRLTWKMLQGTKLSRRENRQVISLHIAYMHSVCMLITRIYIASSYNFRYSSVGPFCRLFDCALYGVAAASRFKAVSQHAA